MSWIWWEAISLSWRSTRNLSPSDISGTGVVTSKRYQTGLNSCQWKGITLPSYMNARVARFFSPFRQISVDKNSSTFRVKFWGLRIRFIFNVYGSDFDYFVGKSELEKRVLIFFIGKIQFSMFFWQLFLNWFRQNRCQIFFSLPQNNISFCQGPRNSAESILYTETQE